MKPAKPWLLLLLVPALVVVSTTGKGNWRHCTGAGGACACVCVCVACMSLISLNGSAQDVGIFTGGAGSLVVSSGKRFSGQGYAPELAEGR